ncbi:MAG: hypothetical protein N3J91_00320, partial [Verrucomicrobiae bacterium]|nr:hypothetical protein [Verrucomicrobiae bacterium]
MTETGQKSITVTSRPAPPSAPTLSEPLALALQPQPGDSPAQKTIPTPDLAPKSEPPTGPALDASPTTPAQQEPPISPKGEIHPPDILAASPQKTEPQATTAPVSYTHL